MYSIFYSEAFGVLWLTRHIRLADEFHGSAAGEWRDSLLLVPITMIKCAVLLLRSASLDTPAYRGSSAPLSVLTTVK
ncbi:hypothetical protein INR49_003157 [Scomber scombrus]|uniref:Uncharacterized protein n=1 Tax=Scomber scombrus TaxID=13677 RepID=A0AAV1PXF4_SCOSC